MCVEAVMTGNAVSDVDDAGTTPLVRLPLPARVELRLIQVENTMVRYQLQLADAPVDRAFPGEAVRAGNGICP